MSSERTNDLGPSGRSLLSTSPPDGEASPDVSGCGADIRLRTSAVFAIYSLYTVLAYLPVLLGRRFFWEDFFIFEYPVREYNFYMLGLKHSLPFWNPFAWAWQPFLADSQSGFWYPTNLLQILLTRIMMPGAAHLPVIVPELMTLLHLPLAAIGLFCLLKREFGIRDCVALITGFTFGFGAKMIAEQNHGMFIMQLSLLPWETLFLLRAWHSWRSALGLGIVFGISFLVGHQQLFLFIALFLGAFTFAEFFRRWLKQSGWRTCIEPLLNFGLAMIVTAGVASIQLLPLLELTNLTPRSHMSYLSASQGSLHPFRFLSFVVPKIYGEFPGFLLPAGVNPGNEMWYWEGAFYWGVLAEILAVFGIARLWKRRGGDDPRSRHLTFFVVFSLFALMYGMGTYAGVQWVFWKCIPIFDHIRMPNRMVCFVWFIGTMATAFGIEELLRSPKLEGKYARILITLASVFFILNLLAVAGAFSFLIKPHLYQQDPMVMLHSLVASFFALIFIVSLKNKWISPRWILPCLATIIILDIAYVDWTWHRNTLNRETLVDRDSRNSQIVQFRNKHAADHSKLLWMQTDSQRRQNLNLGCFLRLPIEFSDDSVGLMVDNPMRLSNSLPPIRDSVKRMEIMGVSTVVTLNGRSLDLPHALPFTKLYHSWKATQSREQEAMLFADSNLNVETTLLVRGVASTLNDTSSLNDSVSLVNYSENELKFYASSSSATMLFVNDLYYPAWKATVDGKETEIVRAFSCLRAIPLRAGSHNVILEYRSAAFESGWKITIGTLILSLGALILGSTSAKGMASRRNNSI